MSNLFIPNTSSSKIFIDGVMTKEWQDFFSGIYSRVGGLSTPIGVEDIVLMMITGIVSPSRVDNIELRVIEVEERLRLVSSTNSQVIKFENTVQEKIDNLMEVLLLGDEIKSFDEKLLLTSESDRVFDSFYGEIYAYEVNSTITISASGIDNRVKVTSFDINGEYNLTSPDHINDHIEIIHPGVYRVGFHANINSVDVTAATFGIMIYKNNGVTPLTNLHVHVDLNGGGSELESISVGPRPIWFDSGDTVEVWCWNYTGTEDILFDDISLYVEKIRSRT